MNGRRYFLDTNAIVQVLAGNRELLALLSDAEYVATSIICELEFLTPILTPILFFPLSKISRDETSDAYSYLNKLTYYIR